MNNYEEGHPSSIPKGKPESDKIVEDFLAGRISNDEYRRRIRQETERRLARHKKILLPNSGQFEDRNR